MTLRASHPALTRSIEEVYADFLVDPPLAPEETIEHRTVEKLDLPTSELAWTSAEIREADDTLHIRRADSLAEWKRSERLCRIAQPEHELAGRYPEAVVGSILRVILSYRLIQENGFLLHSAGLVRDGCGYLFLGVSGAGKSTVTAASLQACTSLSDDLTLSESEIRVPGFAHPVDLELDNPYPDMIGQ